MTDFLLVTWVSALIEIRRVGWMLGLGERWTPGEKLKLLFAGYNGTRNTGSDVRVQEMLRQIRHVLGADNVDFSVMTQSFDRTKATSKAQGRFIFPTYTAVPLSRGAPESRRHRVRRLDVQEQIRQRSHHDDDRLARTGFRGKQTFSRIRRGSGHMDGIIQSMCERYVRDSMVITRNVESQTLLSSLGIPTELGTDTAWTFEPHPPEYARKVLREFGWDEKRPYSFSVRSIRLSGP